MTPQQRTAEHIKKLVDEAPPLTASQRNLLRTLLNGGTACQPKKT